MWFVYILQCSDRSYYVGITNNIEQRLANHREGNGSKYVASHLPFKLVRTEQYETKRLAAKREVQLKGWSHIKKDRLIYSRMKMVSET